MNWKKGDIAICVKTGVLPGQRPENNKPPLRLNMEYIVQGVFACACGSVKLDVGIYSDNKTGCKCGATTSPNSGIWWCNAERFVKKQTQSIEEQIEEAIKAEDYELASELQKQIINQ